MKVYSTCFTLSTEDRTEIADITKLVRDAVQQFAVTTGVALVNTLHTTCALFVNEFQSALIDDLRPSSSGSCRSVTATVTTIHGCRTASAATPTRTSAPRCSAATS